MVVKVRTSDTAAVEFGEQVEAVVATTSRVAVTMSPAELVVTTIVVYEVGVQPDASTVVVL